MTRFISIFSLFGVLVPVLGFAPLHAAETVPASLATPSPTLDSLFSALKRERDPEIAREISDSIRLQWQSSGSATVEALMVWAAKARQSGKQASALDFYDQVIALAPDFAEGWNQRATLHFEMGNVRKSMSDINRVLILEPRHFGALAGMASILTAAGNDKLALEAWQRFLDIYPAERKAQEQLGELEEKRAGNRT